VTPITQQSSSSTQENLSYGPLWEAYDLAQDSDGAFEMIRHQHMAEHLQDSTGIPRVFSVPPGINSAIWPIASCSSPNELHFSILVGPTITLLKK
jgi:hypothetical protein